MLFYLSILIVFIACAAIMTKTVVGYNDFKPATKIWLTFVIVLSWFSPLLLCWAVDCLGLSPLAYNLVSYTGYTLFGLAIIYLVLLLMRDIVWYGIYGIACLMRRDAWGIHPKNITVLNTANFIAFLVALGVGGYAMYQGYRMPRVVEVNVTSPLVKQDVRIVQISDLHVNRTTSSERLRNIVYEVNALAPHIIVITGDTLDDKIHTVDHKLDILGELSAPYGIYTVIGNHEYFSGLVNWNYKANRLKFHDLLNSGRLIKPLNIFISGIPDAYTAYTHQTFRIDFERALKGSSRDNFRILLSHNPSVVEVLTGFNYNLMLSGHTHGGQLFPMHLFIKKVNCGYLSGDYKVNGIDLHVSNGAGTWGPLMRLFAPSDITLITIHPVKK